MFSPILFFLLAFDDKDLIYEGIATGLLILEAMAHFSSETTKT